MLRMFARSIVRASTKGSNVPPFVSAAGKRIIKRRPTIQPPIVGFNILSHGILSRGRSVRICRILRSSGSQGATPACVSLDFSGRSNPRPRSRQFRLAKRHGRRMATALPRLLYSVAARASNRGTAIESPCQTHSHASAATIGARWETRRMPTVAAHAAARRSPPSRRSASGARNRPQRHARSNGPCGPICRRTLHFTCLRRSAKARFGDFPRRIGRIRGRRVEVVRPAITMSVGLRRK